MQNTQQPPPREYESLLARHGLLGTPHVAPDAQMLPVVMRRCIDILWGGVGSTGISWIGFYEKVADADEMVLVCREPKPACSPIGMHGMCGRGWSERRPIIISDVRTLGTSYIACDPKDQSELVIPLLAQSGECLGVLDVDSWDQSSFAEADARGMTRVLVALGLTVPQVLSLPCLYL